MEARLIRAICEFFTSLEWWKPICGFMATNCGKFEGEQNTFDQYQNFLQFQNLVGELVDSLLCRKLNVRPVAFEQAMMQFYDAGQNQVRMILKLIQDLFNFEHFKHNMQITSKQIEEDTTNAMEEFRANCDEGETVDAVTMLEKSEEFWSSPSERRKVFCFI